MDANETPNKLFTKDETGRLAYYPFGVGFRGFYVDESQLQSFTEKAQALQKRSILLIACWILLSLFIPTFFKISIAYPLVIGILIIFAVTYFQVKKITVGLERTPKAFGIDGAVRRLAARFSLRVLILFELIFILCFISVAINIFMNKFSWPNLFLFVFLGGYTFFCGRAILIKKKGGA